MGTVVRGGRISLSIAGPPRFRRLHRELVPQLPGQRARSPDHTGSPQSLCRRQRRLASRRLDPARRSHRPDPRQPRPKWSSGLCPLRPRRSQPPAPSRSSDPRNCDGCSEQAASWRNPANSCFVEPAVTLTAGGYSPWPSLLVAFRPPSSSSASVSVLQRRFASVTPRPHSPPLTRVAKRNP